MLPLVLACILSQLGTIDASGDAPPPRVQRLQRLQSFTTPDATESGKDLMEKIREIGIFLPERTGLPIFELRKSPNSYSYELVYHRAEKNNKIDFFEKTNKEEPQRYQLRQEIPNVNEFKLRVKKNLKIRNFRVRHQREAEEYIELHHFHLLDNEFVYHYYDNHFKIITLPTKLLEITTNADGVVERTNPAEKRRYNRLRYTPFNIDTMFHFDTGSYKLENHFLIKHSNHGERGFVYFTTTDPGPGIKIIPQQTPLGSEEIVRTKETEFYDFKQEDKNANTFDKTIVLVENGSDVEGGSKPSK